MKGKERRTQLLKKIQHQNINYSSIHTHGNTPSTCADLYRLEIYKIAGRVLFYISLCAIIFTSASASNAEYDYAEQVKQRIAQWGTNGFREWTQESMTNWAKEPLHIGITSTSGVGKSTFINTMRGLPPSHAKAAETRSNKECTVIIGEYPDIKNPNLVYYDLPGIGTPNFSKEEYAKIVKLESFDFFIILSSNRFTENDLFLVKELYRLNKKFFFVRTRIDEAISIEYEDKGDAFHEQAYLAQTKQFCEQDLKNIPGTHPVYLISGRLKNYAKWDFPKLVQDLFGSASGLKKEALIRTISANSHDAVDQKAALIEKRIFMAALVSAGFAIAPQPGFSIACDVFLMVNEVSQYLKDFGLDKEGLDILSKIIRIDPTTLGSLIYGASFVHNIPDMALIKKLIMEKASEYALSNVAEETARFIPIIGQVIAPAISYGVVYKILDYFLVEIKTIAHARVDLIVTHSQ